MEYAFRKSALEKEKTYALTKEGIEVTDHEGNKTMHHYSDVSKVNTSYAASKNNSFYQCELKMASGPSLQLKSQHYRGLADFEDRNEAYREFVTALHKLLAAANPNVAYKKGISVAVYIASMAIFIIAGILFPIIAIFALIAGSTIYGIIGIIGSLFLIIRMVTYSKKNKPGNYEPDNIPPNLLPAIG